MRISEALILSVLGIVIVFVMLIFLTVIIQLLSAFARYLDRRGTPVAAGAGAEAPAAVLDAAPEPVVQTAPEAQPVPEPVPEPAPVSAPPKPAEPVTYTLTLEGSSFTVEVADQPDGVQPAQPDTPVAAADAPPASSAAPGAVKYTLTLDGNSFDVEVADQPDSVRPE